MADPAPDGTPPDGMTPDGVPPDGSVPVQPIAQRRPPAIVWVLCGFLLFLAALAAFGVFAAVAFMRSGAEGAAALGVVAAVQFVVYLVVAIFVFRGRSWARRTGIVFSAAAIGLTVIFSVVFQAWPNCLGLLMQVLLLGLLLRKDVVDWCAPR